MSTMRRRSIHFTKDDRVYGLSAYASPDVIAQLRACLHRVEVRPDGHVVLPIKDAAKAAKWAGGFSPLTSPDYDATTAIYECLTYGVFNIFYDGGVDEALAHCERPGR